MKQLWKQFWKLSNELHKLKKQRLQAIKKWDILELKKLDTFIEDNQQKGDLLLDQLKELEMKLPTLKQNA
jgi:hypothetical protein